MELFDIILSLLALVLLEIVLGIDNLVFLSIMTEKLPREQRKRARQWGLTLAWMTRLALLGFAFILVRLTTPWVTIHHWSFSGRDLFLLLGGCFLIVKATQEIHAEMEPGSGVKAISPKKNNFYAVVCQIAIMDIIFSLDSVLTAIGLSNRFWVMALAISLAIIAMLYASEPVSRFIEKHPTLKMLALSFLILVGMLLVADAFSYHVPRGYLYFSMGFSLGVEALNLLRHQRTGHRH